jgi:hypothetical protein
MLAPQSAIDLSLKILISEDAQECDRCDLVRQERAPHTTAHRQKERDEPDIVDGKRIHGSIQHQRLQEGWDLQSRQIAELQES